LWLINGRCDGRSTGDFHRIERHGHCGRYLLFLAVALRIISSAARSFTALLHPLIRVLLVLVLQVLDPESQDVGVLNKHAIPWMMITLDRLL
jgi:hypothetical protein